MQPAGLCVLVLEAGRRRVRTSARCAAPTRTEHFCFRRWCWTRSFARRWAKTNGVPVSWTTCFWPSTPPPPFRLPMFQCFRGGLKSLMMLAGVHIAGDDRDPRRASGEHTVDGGRGAIAIDNFDAAYTENPLAAARRGCVILEVVEHLNPKAGATARGPKNLQSTEAWRAIEEEFLATRRRIPSAEGLHAGHRRGGGQGVPGGDRAGVPGIPGDAGGRRLRPWPDVPVLRSGHRAAAGLGKAGRRAQGVAARDGPPALERGPARELPGADGCGVPGSRGAGKRAGIQPAGPAASGRRPGGLREAGGQAAERIGRCTARR